VKRSFEIGRGAVPVSARSGDAADPPEIGLKAHGVCKRFGSIVAIHDLSLVAKRGEVIGLLGPNGAGKTTAIRVLTTILAPTSGSFAVAGFPHSRPAEIRRRIGVLPESAGYPDQQTGHEFLRYHAELFGQPRAAARRSAFDLLAAVGLSDRASSRIGTYSRGMRQRLGIARALINDPSVVFFDEPTLGLDPAGQREVLLLVANIARDRSATVILSTHFLAEVEEICQRVLILNRGRVIAEGTVSEVTSRAAAPRSGRFRVPAELRSRAVSALGALSETGDARPLDGRPDWVSVTWKEPSAKRAAPAQVSGCVSALAAAGIPLLAFELEGARLSDAFLAITEGD
jgi:ABC-2 type transport system ATP-binding protein